VTRPADIPAEARVRRVLEEYLTECRDNGRRPSVLTLAARLGLSNTTFRRHFPQQAKEIAEARSRPGVPGRPGEAETQPSRYEVLAARNARLRRANRTLTGNLKLAAAQIQRLGFENARLREALEASSNITHIGRPGSR
jgi:predicted ArsR family transcriptional regulator